VSGGVSGSALPTLVVVGSGGRPYREYSFETLAGRYRVCAVLSGEPTWQLPYLADHRVVDPADPGAVAAAVTQLCRDAPTAGLMTWDETALEVTARVARTLGLAHLSPDAAARCRDKYLTRSLLSGSGLPAVRFGLAHSAEEAVRIAEGLGYPVVVKPRALAGSIGVVLASDGHELQEAFRIASGAAFGTLPTGHGVLVEEFLDGPEISVDSVVVDGDVTCLHVARKRLGFPPYFEEVGHLVTDWSGERWADDVRELVTRAHQVLEVDRGVTHAEVRLTAAGPRLVELNGRLGGDLIPAIGRLATGIDLVQVAADLAIGARPELVATRRRVAEVRFVYPARDCVVHSVDLTAARSVPGIERAVALVEPGAALRLPPRQAIPRVAALVAVADTGAECTQALDRAQALVRAEVGGLSTVEEAVGARV
jgi:biotin carboxylase